MFAEDEGVHLRGRDLQFLRQVAAKAGGVQYRAQADDALPGQSRAADGQMRENIDRIAHDDEIGVFLKADLFHLAREDSETDRRCG